MGDICNRMSRYADRHPAAYIALIAGGCICLGTGARAAIDPIVYGVPFITFFPAVALAAYFGGDTPVLPL